jgi:hypothetical protein
MPGPHPTDETPNSLPDPELNPLLNPVLAAHMGRWAEAYFTAPPEKREEAVSELLRELRNDSPLASASVASDHGIDDANLPRADVAKHEENSETPALEEVPPDSSAAAIAPALTCGVCDYQNAAGQVFCGMCGTRLRVQPEALIPQVAEVAPISTAYGSEAESFPSENFREYANEPDFSPTTAADVEYDAIEPAATKSSAIQPAAIESVWTLPHRNLPHFALEPEPESVPYRYRIYIGGVLAILLVLLLYMAWRGTQAISGTGGSHSSASRTIPPAPPAAVPEPAEHPVAVAPTAAPAATPAASAQPSASESASSKVAPPASQVRSEKPLAPVAHKTVPVAIRRKPPAITMVASSSPLAADGSGAEEMASAEKYLNGSPRDSREAAQWLWKAVGKGNVGATIALSDLYLRGDGVPKSCDQARLLLDAAARKGGRAAAERLRNLQAFGCN